MWRVGKGCGGRGRGVEGKEGERREGSTVSSPTVSTIITCCMFLLFRGKRRAVLAGKG